MAPFLVDSEERFIKAMTNRTSRRHKGVAAVELAVLLPLLAFLFLIAVDYARIFYYALTIDNCARNGALCASNAINYPIPYSSIAQAAVADGANLNPPLATSAVTVANSTDADGNPSVTVTIKYTFQSITNYPGLPNTVNLTRSVEMRVAPQSLSSSASSHPKRRLSPCFTDQSLRSVAAQWWSSRPSCFRSPSC